MQFTDLSQGVGSNLQTWLWHFGDPASGSANTSSLQNPTHVYNTAGTYIVSLTVSTSNACEGTAVDTIEIAPPPPLDWFVSPDTNCFGSLTYFFTDTDTTNTAEVISYAWNFGDPASGINDTSNLQNPTHLFTAPGTYAVSLTIVNVDGCQNTRVHNVQIRRPPVADFTHEQGCLMDSTLFSDESISLGSVIVSWQWDFGDPASGAANTSALQNTGHVFSGVGTYNVQLIATDMAGCADTIIKTITVDMAPMAHFTYNQPCDPPGLVYFSDSSFIPPGAAPITEWLWEIEPGYFSSEINPVYTFDQYDTCYVVHLTVTDQNGCENTVTDTVCVFPPLIGDFASSRVCLGDTTWLWASHSPAEDTILSYSWQMGHGTTITTDADSVAYLYQTPGNFYATLTIINQNGCE